MGIGTLFFWRFADRFNAGLSSFFLNKVDEEVRAEEVRAENVGFQQDSSTFWSGLVLDDTFIENRLSSKFVI